MEQLEAFHESITDALRATVAALGGIKLVAGMLWPEKPVDEGARFLADCLNPERAARLDPEHLLLLLKLARAKGIHLGPWRGSWTTWVMRRHSRPSRRTKWPNCKSSSSARPNPSKRSRNAWTGCG